MTPQGKQPELTTDGKRVFLKCTCLQCSAETILSFDAQKLADEGLGTNEWECSHCGNIGKLAMELQPVEPK